MNTVTAAEDSGKSVESVAGWRRWVISDAAYDSELLVSQASESAVPSRARIVRTKFLRHPRMARVVDMSFDGEGARVVEEIGDARPLSDGRCRLPRGETRAKELLRVLEAAAYLQRQETAHGAISRATVFSDGQHLLLTGAALSGDSAAAPTGDVRAWAKISLELLPPKSGGEMTEVVREAASQVMAAPEMEHSLDAPRVVRAINRALIGDKSLGSVGERVSEKGADESEQSKPMRASLAGVHVIGSLAVGLFTTLLTLAVIGAVIAGGLMWFFKQLPSEVPMPNVVGMERQAASDRLEAEGLNVARVRSVYREEMEPGQVAETQPPAGMMVREGREVTLVVSLGAARVRVPRLTGLKSGEAEDVLEEKGLHLVDGGKMRSNTPEGEIVKQEPAATTKIAQGERVVVQTSGGPQFGIVEIPADDEDGAPRQIVFRQVEIIVPRGDALQRVVVREGYGDDLETTYDRLHRPGDRIKLDTHGRPGKNVKVMIEGDQVFKTQL